MRGYLLAPYHHLANRKDSKGEFMWPNDKLKKFLRDGNAITFRQRRDLATSSIVGAHGIRQRAPKKYADNHGAEDGKFKAVPREEKRLSEAHKSEIMYKEILKRDQEKTMTRRDPSRVSLENEALKIA